MGIKVRNEVKDFSEFMEKKLCENDHKGGWSDCTDAYLLKRAYDEFDELIEAVNNGIKKDIVHEAVDVANFCMMLANNQIEEDDPCGR